MRYLMLGVVAVVAMVMACSKKNTTGPDIGPPAQLVIVSPDGQEQVVGERLENQLVVRVTDADEKPVPDVEVSWSVTSGEGSLGHETSTTNESGDATAGWTLGTAPGENGASAQVEGLGSVTFTAMALVGPPAMLILVSGDEQEAKPDSVFTDSLVVRIEDVFGNPVPDAEVSWQVIAGGGSVNPEISVTDDAGEAGTEWTAGEPDTNMAAARVEGLTQIAFTAAVLSEEEPEPDPEPETLEHAGGNGQAARSGNTLPEPLVVRVLDTNGDPMGGVEVVWSVASGNGSVSPKTSTTNNSGEASTVWTLGPEPGDMQATATVDGINPLAFAATGTPEPAPDEVERVSGNGQKGRVGSTLPDSLVVKVTDSDGKPAPGVEVVWSTGSGTLNPSVSNTNNEGLARSRWTLGAEPGDVKATAIAEGLDPVTFSATAEPLPEPEPTTLERAGGNGQTAEVGSILPNPLVVRVLDQDDEPMSGVEVVWSVASGGGTVKPTTSTTNNAGRASTQWALGDEPGQNRVRATVKGLDAITFNATAEPESEPEPGPPASLQIVGDSVLRGIAGKALPDSLTVRVRDANGLPVPGVKVRWEVLFSPSNRGAVRPSASTTDDAGEARAELLLDTALGDYTEIRAVVEDVGGVKFRAIGELEPGAVLEIVSGDGQVAPVGEIVPEPLVVRLRNADGHPIPGVGVQWFRHPEESGCSTFHYTETDAAGETQAMPTDDELRLCLGKNEIQALIAEADGVSVTFTATGVRPGPAAAMEIVSGNNQEAYRGEWLPDPLVARVVDEHGVPVSGERVTWSEFGGDDRETLGITDEVTDENSETRMEWRMPYVYGTRATQVVLYDSLDDCCTGVEFWATSLPHPNDTDGYPLPTTAEIVGGDGQVGVVGQELPEPLVMRVYDQYGNVMPYADVWWSTTDDPYDGDPQGGRLTGYRWAKDGPVSVRWTLPTEPGTYNVRTWLGHEMDDPYWGGPRGIVPGPTFTATAVSENN